MFNCLYNPLSWIAITASVVVGMLVFAALCRRKNPHRAKKWRIYAKRTSLFTGFWLPFCCTPLFAMLLALDVEEHFPEWKMDQIPEAEAILLSSNIPGEGVDEAARKVGQLLAAKKSERVSRFSGTPDGLVAADLVATNLSSEVFVPYASVDHATTNRILLVSDIWRIEKDYIECMKIFTNSVVCPVAYGHLIGNRPCSEMKLTDFLPSPQGARLVAQTLKNLLESPQPVLCTGM